MSELLTVAEAARRLKVSESFLSKVRKRGEGPRCIKIGRLVRYRLDDVDSWAETVARAPEGGDE